MITLSSEAGIKEYGEPEGYPVFYFHGFPGSRLDGELFEFDEAGKRTGTRIIAIDRPGIGNSEFQPKRKILDWPVSVSAVADLYGIKKFSVLGISGGGPYALACAYAIHDRVRSVAVVSGMGPYHYKESKTGKAMIVPKQIALVRRLFAWGMSSGALKNPERLEKNIMDALPKADRDYLSKPGKMDHLINLFKEAFKQGPKGYLQEAKLYRRDWGFQLSQVNVNISFWHGRMDDNVVTDVTRRIASEIPGSKTTFIEHEGHFSVTGYYLDQILTELK
jgi:pimeloyl-ACP methyl ester carboxylesterase